MFSDHDKETCNADGSFNLKGINNFCSKYLSLRCFDEEKEESRVTRGKASTINENENEFQRMKVFTIILKAITVNNKSDVAHYTPSAFFQFVSLTLNAIVLVLLPDRENIGSKRFRLDIGHVGFLHSFYPFENKEVYFLYHHHSEYDVWHEEATCWGSCFNDLCVKDVESGEFLGFSFNHFNLLKTDDEDLKQTVRQHLKNTFDLKLECEQEGIIKGISNINNIFNNNKMIMKLLLSKCL